MNSVDYGVLQGDINIVTDILSRLKTLLENKNISADIKKYIEKILLLPAVKPL